MNGTLTAHVLVKLHSVELVGKKTPENLAVLVGILARASTADQLSPMGANERAPGRATYLT